MWDAIKEYYILLGEKYSVNPVIFLGLHVLATPFFLFCAGRVVKNIKNKKPALLPIFLTAFFFNVANIYLVIAGKDIPFWIYGIIGLMTLFSGYMAYRKIMKRAAA